MGFGPVPFFSIASTSLTSSGGAISGGLNCSCRSGRGDPGEEGEGEEASDAARPAADGSQQIQGWRQPTLLPAAAPPSGESPAPAASPRPPKHRTEPASWPQTRTALAEPGPARSPTEHSRVCARQGLPAAFCRARFTSPSAPGDQGHPGQAPQGLLGLWSSGQAQPLPGTGRGTGLAEQRGRGARSRR